MKVTLDKFETAVERFITEHLGGLLKEHPGVQFGIGFIKETKKAELMDWVKDSDFFEDDSRTIDIDCMEKAISSGFKMSGGKLPIPLKFNVFGMKLDLGTIVMDNDSWVAFKRYL